MHAPALHRRHGLTITEMMIVVAVTATILVIAAPSMHEFMVRQRVRAINAELVNDLQFARSESITRNRTVWLSFRTDDAAMTCYTIHTRGVLGNCDCRQPPGTACPDFPELVEIKTVQVLRSTTVTLQPPAAPANFVHFSEPQGVSNRNDFQVIVESSGGAKLRSSSNRLGRPQVCSPNGTIPGVTTC